MADRYVVLKLESYEGEDTYLRCGNDSQDYIYSVVSLDENGNAEIIDNGYRSYDEAIASWPEARAS